MIVDRDPNVVFLHKLFNSRRSFGCGVAGDDGADSGSLAIFELSTNILVFVLGKCHLLAGREGQLAERMICAQGKPEEGGFPGLPLENLPPSRTLP